jgi:hypothetical protein
MNVIKCIVTILGSHTGGYEGFYLLGYTDVEFR